MSRPRGDSSGGIKEGPGHDITLVTEAYYKMEAQAEDLKLKLSRAYTTYQHELQQGEEKYKANLHELKQQHQTELTKLKAASDTQVPTNSPH